MAITGTGTQADPYVVSTWDDFVTAVGTSGAYVEVTPNTVWDMNEIVREGIESINVSCRQINGNGLVIKALRASGYVLEITRSISITGLSILSFLAQGLIWIKDSSSSWFSNTFTDCNFSGEITGQYVLGSAFGSSNEIQGQRCAVSVKGAALNWCNRDNHTFKDSNIYFEGPTINGLVCNNCIIAGSLADTSSQIIYSTGSTINLYGEANVTWGYNADGRAVTVFNSDRLPNSSENTSYNVKAVTDAQMRDTAYLDSIGLPIGVLNYG